jgi:hypothetical protein
VRVTAVDELALDDAVIRVVHDQLARMALANHDLREWPGHP